MKRIIKYVCLLTIFCMVILSASCFSKKETSVVTLRVNPEIELICVGDTVKTASALNEDGEVVLCKIDLKGKNVDDAACEFIDTTINLGYLKVSALDNKVYVSCDSKTVERAEELLDEVTNTVNNHFTEIGVYGKAILEEFTDLAKDAHDLGVSIMEARLIERISDLYPEMSVEDIKKMSYEQKVTVIETYYVTNNFTVELQKKYKEGVETLKAEYTRISELAASIADLTTRINNPNTTDEEKEVLREELNTKQNELSSLKDEYTEKLNTLKNTTLAQVQDSLNKTLDTMNSLYEENKAKLEEHLNSITDKIKDLISAWQQAFGK